MTSNPLKYHHFWTHCPCLRKGIFLHRSIRDWQKMQLFPSQFLSLVSGSAQRKHAHVENKGLTISTSPFSEHLVKYQMAFFCVCMCVLVASNTMWPKTIFSAFKLSLVAFLFYQPQVKLQYPHWDIKSAYGDKMGQVKIQSPGSVLQPQLQKCWDVNKTMQSTWAHFLSSYCFRLQCFCSFCDFVSLSYIQCWE